MSKKGRTRQIALSILPHQQVPDGDWTVWLIYGGRGVGKSWRLTSWITNQALAYPGTQWAAVGRTWAETRSILAEGPSSVLSYLTSLDMESALEGGSWASAYTRVPGNTKVRFANGSQITFLSADKPDALRGGNYHGAIADELAFWDKTAWSNLRLATRLSPADDIPPRIIAATTPNGSNWLYTDLIAAAPVPGVVYIGGSDLPPATPPSTYDNRHLSTQAVEAFRAIYEGTDLGKQELHGGFLTAADSVFDLNPVLHSEAADSVQLPTDPSQADEVVAGLDLGAENPSALIILARLDTRWHAVAEVYGPAATPDALIDMSSAVLDHWQPSRIVSDTNFPQTTNHLRAKGLPIVPADKKAGSVLDGIRAIQAALAQSNLTIDTQACPHLWAELRGYRWATDKDGNALTPERPVKRDDHTVDALRYVLHQVTQSPARDLIFS